MVCICCVENVVILAGVWFLHKTVNLEENEVISYETNKKTKPKNFLLRKKKKKVKNRVKKGCLG